MASATINIGDYSYKRSEVLGAGSAASVYKGIHVPSGDGVAIKSYNDAFNTATAWKIERKFCKTLLANPNTKEFKHMLKCKAIFPIHRIIVYELCDGTVDELVKRKYPRGMPACVLAKLFTTFMSTLISLRQQKMLHGDYKPANMLYIQHGPHNYEFKLSDFNMAGKLNNELERVGVCGTRSFIPEDHLFAQATASVPIAHDATIDVWGLACSFLFAITGEYQMSAMYTGLGSYYLRLPNKFVQLLEKILYAMYGHARPSQFETITSNLFPSIAAPQLLTEAMKLVIDHLYLTPISIKYIYGESSVTVPTYPPIDSTNYSADLGNIIKRYLYLNYIAKKPIIFKVEYKYCDLPIKLDAINESTIFTNEESLCVHIYS